jgi:hypothetical protein
MWDRAVGHAANLWARAGPAEGERTPAGRPPAATSASTQPARTPGSQPASQPPTHPPTRAVHNYVGEGRGVALGPEHQGGVDAVALQLRDDLVAEAIIADLGGPGARAQQTGERVSQCEARAPAAGAHPGPGAWSEANGEAQRGGMGRCCIQQPLTLPGARAPHLCDDGGREPEARRGGERVGAVAAALDLHPKAGCAGSGRPTQGTAGSMARCRSCAAGGPARTSLPRAPEPGGAPLLPAFAARGEAPASGP